MGIWTHFLGLGGVALALGLGQRKLPTKLGWKWTLLVTEFAHWTVPVWLGWGAWAVVNAGGGLGWAVAGAALGTTAVALRPLGQAWRLRCRLPEALNQVWPLAAGERSRLDERGSGKTTTHTWAGPGGPLTADLFCPDGSSPGGWPVVMVVHGGGWDRGDRHQLPELNAWLCRRGYAVLAVSYRLAPHAVWPAARDDVRSAFTWLDQAGAALGLDPQRVVLLGRSAGGQIAEAVAYESPPTSLRGLVSLYAPADLLFAWQHTPERDVLNSFLLMRNYLGGTPETHRDAFVFASPWLAVRAGAVPTLLVHGRGDTLVWHRQSERLAERLAACGVPHYFLDLPWATHAFDYTLRGPGGWVWCYTLEWYLKAVLSTAERRG